MRGWAVATNRIVLRTNDGGAHWSTQELPYPSPSIFTDIYFADEHVGWIATNLAASSSMEDGSPVLRSTDSGVTWVTAAEVRSLFITSIHFISSAKGWAGGMEGIYYTDDGGSNWECQYQKVIDPVVSLSFVGGKYGWALGFKGTILRYRLR
jgi:photosystem II stability/assembly factor-like uncharacterized protein